LWSASVNSASAYAPGYTLDGKRRLLRKRLEKGADATV